MNLIERKTEESVIDSFRTVQYTKIPEIIITGINYLIDLGLEYDEKFYDKTINSVEIFNDNAYRNCHHFASSRCRLKLNDNMKNNWFFHICVPELIDGTFFKLNGVYYIPILYIADEPIILKEKSIVLQSTFQPLTLYFGEGRVIFMGTNILISDFLQIISNDWEDDFKKEVEAYFNISLSSNMNSIIGNFSQKFNTDQDIKSIIEKINKLFFDSWTVQLYKNFYNIKPTIENVIKIALDKKINNKKPNFTDLRYKRLTFIEPLLKPYTKAISDAAKGLLKGYNIHSLKLKLNTIIQHFFLKLHGESLYDTTNGFSAILNFKATFKNPYGQNSLPNEVSSIHWSHKGRICPNSITNQDPGESVSLVPNQNIDLDFGIFKFTKEEKEISDDVEFC